VDLRPAAAAARDTAAARSSGAPQGSGGKRSSGGGGGGKLTKKQDGKVRRLVQMEEDSEDEDRPLVARMPPAPGAIDGRLRLCVHMRGDGGVGKFRAGGPSHINLPHPPAC
jgi:hypothetical protein